ATDAQADAHARAQVRDWPSFAAALRRADALHARPRADRWSEEIEDATCKRSKGWNMFADFLRDTRYAIRQLAKNPGFTAVAVLTLAFGIGANSAIFSVVNGVLLRPLPYPDPDSLVRVYEVVPQYGTFAVAPANFFDWREQNTVFERIAMYNTSSVSYSEGEIPERIVNATVSWDTFDLLRAQPMLGRTFTAEEDAPGKNNVIILSYGMWQRLFGGDRSVLGRAVKLNNAMSTIIGVMPSGFYFPTRDAQLWSPIAINRANATRGGHYLGVIARLNKGVPVEQAGAEMKAIATRLAQQYPASNAGESAEVMTLHEQVVGDVRPALLTLLAAVGLVVLIACGNVANLLLVRASVRQKEIAVRTALGAGRRRLMLQMLAESTVLALAGGALGLLLAYAAIKPLQTLSAGSVPRVEDVAIDGSVLAFTLALALFTGVVFGFVPAWQASRANLSEVLKEGGRASASSGSRWLRNTLVVAEVALSLVLLVGASLLLRSFAKLTNVDPGFRAENVLAFRVALPRASYPQPQNQIAFYDGLLRKLESLPQVTSAGMTQTLPLQGHYSLSFLQQGRPPLPPAEQPSANYRAISPRYFE
ncbi:MAG: ABC transporter permease, partial [Candidatus Acidiferrales bacterium]